MKQFSIELIKKHKLRTMLIALIVVCLMVLVSLYMNNGSSTPMPIKKQLINNNKTKKTPKDKREKALQANPSKITGQYANIQLAKLSKMQKFDQFIKSKILSDQKISEDEKEAYLGYLYSLNSLIQKKSDEDKFEDKLSNLNNKSQLTTLEKQISKNEEEEARSKLAIAKSAFEQKQYSAKTKDEGTKSKSQATKNKVNPLDVLSVRVIYEKSGKKHALLAVGDHTHKVSVGSRLFNGKYSVNQVKNDSVTIENLKTKKLDTFLIR